MGHPLNYQHEDVVFALREAVADADRGTTYVLIGAKGDARLERDGSIYLGPTVHAVKRNSTVSVHRLIRHATREYRPGRMSPGAFVEFELSLDIDAIEESATNDLVDTALNLLNGNGAATALLNQAAAEFYKAVGGNVTMTASSGTNTRKRKSLVYMMRVHTWGDVYRLNKCLDSGVYDPQLAYVQATTPVFYPQSHRGPTYSALSSADNTIDNWLAANANKLVRLRYVHTD